MPAEDEMQLFTACGILLTNKHSRVTSKIINKAILK